MTGKRITYGQLHRLLRELEFVHVPMKRKWKAYRHAKSDTLILLADRQPNQPARDPELISVRRHLVENGIVGADDLDRLLGEVEAA